MSAVFADEKSLFATSEEWLQAAVDTSLRSVVQTITGMVIPDVRIGVGFPSTGKSGSTLAETWPRKAANDNVNEITVRVTMSDPVEVLGVLLHELIHVGFDGKYGHGKRFQKEFARLGFMGDPKGHMMSPELRNNLKTLADSLGVYPRKEGLQEFIAKHKQTTRLHKVICQTCSLNFRLTQKWIDKAVQLDCPDRACVGGIMVD